MTTNLWGNLLELDDAAHPVAILKAQADVLTELTDRLLRGRITRSAHGTSGPPYCYELEIVAPGLSHETYSILTVEHGRVAYPLVIHAGQYDQPVWCRDEAEFVRNLGAILAAERTQRTLAVLIAQSSVLGDFRDYVAQMAEDEIPF